MDILREVARAFALVMGASVVFSTLLVLAVAVAKHRPDPAGPGYYRGEEEADAYTAAAAGTAADEAARRAARAEAQEAETG